MAVHYGLRMANRLFFVRVVREDTMVFIGKELMVRVGLNSSFWIEIGGFSLRPGRVMETP